MIVDDKNQLLTINQLFKSPQLILLTVQSY